MSMLCGHHYNMIGEKRIVSAVETVLYRNGLDQWPPYRGLNVQALYSTGGQWLAIS